MTFGVCEKSILELQAAQASGAVTACELVRHYFERIQAYDQSGPMINAIVALNPDALSDAYELDLERSRTGPRGPLHGIPILVKDNYDTANMPTAAGTLSLATMQPGADAQQIHRLRQAGAVILGKTAMHELAAGITNVSSLSGFTRNPYALAHIPGGSSGGSAAAVAASFCAAAMGSDTCGSIRIPASAQNLVGLRVTFGLSSRAGIVPLSRSQDVVGPLARTVEDLAIMLDATVGEDDRDPSTIGVDSKIPKSYLSSLRDDALCGLRIGVLSDFFGDAAEDAEVAQLVRQALGAMQGLGAHLSAASIDSFGHLLAPSSTILHEFKFDLARYLAGQPTAAVKSLGEIIDLGLHHDQLDATLRLRNKPEHPDTDAYQAALAMRSQISEALLSIFASVDVVAYPTMRRPPARLGDQQLGSNSQLSASTGMPSVSFPVGFTTDGLPVGIEFLAPKYSEAALLGYAYAWEQAKRPRRPPPSTPALG